jgi:hypothetical protein
VEGFAAPAFRDLRFSPKRTKGLERAFVTLLAGEIDSIPLGVGVRCQALRGLCAIQSRHAVAARVRPFKIMLSSPVTMPSTTADVAHADAT